jgi:hypothetical protein
MAGKMPKALEELRTETQYQLAVRPPCLPRATTQKIVNRLSGPKHINCYMQGVCRWARREYGESSKSLFTIFSVRAVIRVDICRGNAEAIGMEDEAEKAVSE